MPDRNRKPSGARPEFEIAYYTKELGKSLQREMLQQQLARLSESNGNGRNYTGAARHGEDAAPELVPAPPQEDRAG
jgi:hypothetical protein